MNSDNVDYILLGVDNSNQLKAILSQSVNSKKLKIDMNEFELKVAKNLLDPRSWN